MGKICEYEKNERDTSIQIVQSVGEALFMTFSMFWEILWPLILGFLLSGVVQVVVSHRTIACIPWNTWKIP